MLLLIVTLHASAWFYWAFIKWNLCTSYHDSKIIEFNLKFSCMLLEYFYIVLRVYVFENSY